MIKKFQDRFRLKLKDIHFRELLTNSALAFAYRIGGQLLVYVSTILIASLYGARGMGIYSLALSALLILEMCATLGMKISVLRFVGEFQASNSLDKIKSLFVSVTSLVLPLSIVMGSLTFIYAEKLAAELFHEPTFALGFQLVGVFLPFHALDAVNLEFIRGLKNIKISEYLRNVNRQFFHAVFLLGVSVLSRDVFAPLITFFMATIVTFFISESYLIVRLNKNSFASDALSKRKILQISAPMMMTGFTFLIMGRVDTLMLGYFCNLHDVGIYSISLKLAAITSFVLQAVSTIAAPKFAEFHWNNDHENLKNTIRWSSKLIFWFSFPILLFLIIFSEFSMRIFGPEFVSGSTALVFLSFGQFINASSGSVGNLLNMCGEQKVFSGIILSASILNVVLCYVLIPIFGFNGAAIATMISMIFWNLAAVFYIKKTKNINTFYFPFLTR